MGNLADTGDALEDALNDLDADVDLSQPATNPTTLTNSDGQVITLDPEREKIITKPIAQDASKRVAKRRVVLKEQPLRKIRLVMKEQKND